MLECKSKENFLELNLTEILCDIFSTWINFECLENNSVLFENRINFFSHSSDVWNLYFRIFFSLSFHTRYFLTHALIWNHSNSYLTQLALYWHSTSVCLVNLLPYTSVWHACSVFNWTVYHCVYLNCFWIVLSINKCNSVMFTMNTSLCALQ